MQLMRLTPGRPAPRLGHGPAAAASRSACARPAALRQRTRSSAAASGDPETDVSAAAVSSVVAGADATASVESETQAAAPAAPPQEAPLLDASSSRGSKSGKFEGDFLESGSSASAAPAAAMRRPPAARMSLQAFLEIDDGPPRVMSLLDPHVMPGAGAEEERAAAAGRADLPLLLYLPGIDGSGMAAARQFPSLLRKFDMRTLVTPPPDRTPFEGLVAIVADFLRQEVPACPPTRPVYLLGESFGGVLALAVAAECPSLVDRLVLVNPATSFSSSLWPVLGPLLPQMPPELYRALPIALAPILANPLNLLAAGFEVGADEPLQQRAASLLDTAVGLLQQLPVLAEILPAETLAWKLELLAAGSAAVEPLLPRIQQRCFVMVGDQDLLIPSREEGPRLQRALPRAQLRVEKGRSHALLQEGGIDLAAVLEEEGFYVSRRHMSAPVTKRTARGFGVAVPIELPSPRELDSYAERATAFGRRLTSPVFISTAPDGTRCLGLGQIPEGRPLLLVGNHQTLALDLGVLTEQFIRELGILPRGLAHPVIFSQQFGSGEEGEAKREAAGAAASSGGADAPAAGSSGSGSGSGSGSELTPWDPNNLFGEALQGRGLAALRGMMGGRSSADASRAASTGGGGEDGRSAFREFMQTFGAVPVSAFNMHRLLSNGEAVLLFPGGVREAYKRQGEDYQLFWPAKSEFVRMAAKHNCTIVPFAAVGVDDSLNMIADARQLGELPVVGEMLKARAGGVPQARQGVSAGAEEESFISPLVAPKLPPGRMYFVFQQPIQTCPEDLKDRARCDELYAQTKASVEQGISYLLDQRQADPFGEFLPRQLWEAVNRGRQAPTFPLN